MGAAGTTSHDIDFMRIALRMARRGLGTTAPNPSVGAVIVDEATGEIIARGWTQPGGRPHAEKEALRQAGPRARAKTMYLTLEPCANTGRLPTCADAMLTAGLARVVCAIADPNPVIAGRGFEQLRAAGVEVDIGVGAEEAWWLTAGHILRNTARRPFVQIKMALDADGSVPRGHAGRAVMVTGPESRARAHLMRAESDAILIGNGTLRDDNPRLTCRLPGLARRSPRPVVLASRHVWALRESRLVAEPRAKPLLLMTSPEASESDCAALVEAGVEVVRAPEVVAGQIAPRPVLEHLARLGVTRVLVEGGAEIWTSLVKASLVDEAVVFVAGGAGMAEWRDFLPHPLSIDRGPGRLEHVGSTDLGRDRMLVFRRRNAIRDAGEE